MPRIDVEKLAQAVGLKPNEVRAHLRITTSFQKQVRDAKTFEEIAEFKISDESSFRTCGPGYTAVEIEEYRAKRAELFAVYISNFNTPASFKRISAKLTHDEIGIASKKFKDFMFADINAADSPGALRGLDLFLSEFTNKGRSHSLGAEAPQKTLQGKAQSLFYNEMRTVTSISEAEQVFNRWGPLVHLIATYDNKYTWSFAWGLATHFEMLLDLEGKISSRFIEYSTRPVSFNDMLSILIKKHWETLPSFSDAIAAAQVLSVRDKQKGSSRGSVRYPDFAYTCALTETIPHIKTKEDLEIFFGIWQKREKSNTGSNFERRNHPTLPDSFNPKWDEIYLPDLDQPLTLDELIKLHESSRWSTAYRTKAHEMIREILRNQITNAQSMEELKVLEDNSKFREFVWSELDQKKKHFQKERALEIIEVGNNREHLIWAFNFFRDRGDEEQVALILKKLAPFFVSEELDVVEV